MRAQTTNRNSFYHLFLVLVLLVVTTADAKASIFSGKVVRIIDGDTIVILTTERRVRVRLAGIDTPEKNQPWGNAATREMRRLVAGRTVDVEWHKKDRWNRKIGIVYSEGQDVGLVMVERGFAWHFKRYANEQTHSNREAYAAAEASARHRKKGLWSDPEPIAPWEWRRR